MNRVLSNLSQEEIDSLLTDCQSAIGDMHSQQQYREHLDHEALNVVGAMWGEILAEKGYNAARKDLVSAFDVFFDLVIAKHNADSDELPFEPQEVYSDE